MKDSGGGCDDDLWMDDIDEQTLLQASQLAETANHKQVWMFASTSTHFYLNNSVELIVHSPLTISFHRPEKCC